MELQIRKLSKTYPNGVEALKDITLTIPQGMYGLLGPNGAGKSTLMRTIATLQEPDAGSIHLGDIDVLAERERVRETLGYLPQEFGVYPKVSAEELLDHFAVLKGITGRRGRREIVEALLRQVNLYDARKKKLGGYSGGMRQRFGVAVALLGDPKLIIVDEPTAGLDPAERVRFLNLLSEIGQSAVVLLSTHIVEDVSELCSRMAIIDRGEILLEAEPLAAVAAARDVETRMHPLLYTSPVGKAAYLGGRFLAAFTLGALMIGRHPDRHSGRRAPAGGARRPHGATPASRLSERLLPARAAAAGPGRVGSIELLARADSYTKCNTLPRSEGERRY